MLNFISAATGRAWRTALLTPCLASISAGLAVAGPMTPPPVLPPPHDVHAPPLPVAELQARELRRYKAQEAR